MKLALGTVQFGLQYGVANTSGQVKPSEVLKILNLARSCGIDTLDTAAAYGDSESVLGTAGVGDFDIVTKIPPFPVQGPPISDWIEATVLHSIKTLGQKSIKGLLFHRSQDLLRADGPLAYSTLAKLKEQGLVEKIGVSVYSPTELDALFLHFKFDIVQVPMNIFDRRIVLSGWLDKLKNFGVEVHIRSAFLQGLLLMPPQKRPGYFLKWDDIFRDYDVWLKEEGLTALHACLGFLHAVKGIDKIVVGTDSASQLEQIIESFKPLRVSVPDSLMSSDESLINPSLWRVQ